MPRGTTTYNTESAKDTTKPIILLRVLDIPRVDVPGETISLYLTDCESDVAFFDENDLAQTYTSCGLKYEKVQVNNTNEIDRCKISIDNVDRAFSALAQYCKLQKVEVHVLRAFRDTLTTTDGAITLFIGHTKAPVIGEHYIEAEVSADFSLQEKVPRRTFCTRDFPYLPASKDIRNPL